MKKAISTVQYYIKLSWLFAKYSLMEQMEYRVNFLAGIAVECGYMLIKIMYAALILHAGVEINGLTVNEMTMCVGTYIMMTGLFMAVYPNFCVLPYSVQDGSLDILLTKPLNTQFFVTLRKLDFGMPIPNIVCGIVMIIYGWRSEDIPLTWITLVGFIVYCIAGLFLTYCLFLIPELLSFWFVSNQGVHQLSEAIRDFDNVPMNIYPKWIQRLGIFIIPVFIITNSPTLFVAQKLSVGLAVWGIVAPIIVFVLQRLVWREALKQYTSASG